jgi:SAM-dependent methyltransferase
MEYISLWKKLKLRVQKEQFEPTWLGILLNPVHIVRSGLNRCIRDFAPEVCGDILDFGCGSKPYKKMFYNADSYTGCDTCDSGHDHHNSSVDFYYDGRILPFSNNQFDAVVSFEVFEHVFDLQGSLSEINRVTKDDGLLLISVPFVWAEHEAPFDYTRYTSYGIALLLEKSGFDIVKTRTTSSDLLTIFQLFIYYLMQVTPKNRLFYLFQLFVFFPLTFISYVIDWALPTRNDLFLGNVVLARKKIVS